MTKKPLDRRTFLRGTGVFIGLPLLDAMLPSRAYSQAAQGPIRFMPIQWQYGTYLNSLSPTGSGTNFNLPDPYSALNPYKAYITPVINIQNAWGNVDGGGDHARAQGTYLTCARANKSESNIRCGISADQVIANSIGNKTRIKSLYLAGGGAIDADSGYGSAYSHISWINPTTPNTPVGTPYQVFASLFGQGNQSPSGDAQQLAKLRLKKSILDGAIDDANRLSNSLGGGDRQRLDQYLTSVREVEKGISQQLSDGGTLGQCSPGSSPPQNLDYQERIKSLFDLAVLAFQCDATRIVPFLMGTRSNFYPYLGVSGEHHLELSHHGDNQTKIAALLKINKWYADRFAEFLNKMASVKDLDGQTLLHNSIVTYGGDMRDGNMHDDDNIPLLVVGRGGGQIKGGQLINTKAKIPIANVWLSAMHAMGVNQNQFGEGIGQSTGTLPW